MVNRVAVVEVYQNYLEEVERGCESYHASEISSSEVEVKTKAEEELADAACEMILAQLMKTEKPKASYKEPNGELTDRAIEMVERRVIR